MSRRHWSGSQVWSWMAGKDKARNDDLWWWKTDDRAAGGEEWQEGEERPKSPSALLFIQDVFLWWTLCYHLGPQDKFNPSQQIKIHKMAFLTQGHLYMVAKSHQKILLLRHL